MTRDEAIARLRALLPQLNRECHVESLGLFGSLARGEERPDSDVDVLVRFEPHASVTLFTLARVLNRLEVARGASVDVVDDHPRLRPALRAAIERDLTRVA